MQKVKSVSVSSKGQITLSSHARKELGLEKGSSLMEIVVGNCVILLPQNEILGQIRKRAQAALKKAGVTANDIQAEVEHLKSKRFKKQYPSLS